MRASRGILRRGRRRVAGIALILPAMLAVPPCTAFAGHRAAPRTVMFDALFARSGFRDSAPAGDSVGDRQYASGPLHDRSGVTVGRFSFTCTWIAVHATKVNERCSGEAVLRHGRLHTRGPALRSDASHRWSIVGGSGIYAAARGSVIVHDLGTRESVIVATLTTGAPAHMPGEVPRPAANGTFIARAEAVCAAARTALAALPSFPLDTFDPAHPTADQLHVVGAYFTGAGDPRPAFRAELAGLTALGVPPAQAGGWNAVIASRTAVLPAVEAQDSAAVGGDVPAFVASLQAVSGAIRREALAVAVFGALGCYPA